MSLLYLIMVNQDVNFKYLLKKFSRKSLENLAMNYWKMNCYSIKLQSLGKQLAKRK